MFVDRARIVVLFHEGDRYLPTFRYIVHYLAEFWREAGHEVEFVFGPHEQPSADLVFVHVNLSVVPQAYLEFAARYPKTVNARVTDIRKTAISDNVVTQRGSWDGPVIVKSNLNYAGLPEQMLHRSWLARHWSRAHELQLEWQRRRGRISPFSGAGDYEIYESIDEVPRSRLEHDQLVVERFLPEREHGLYYCRFYQFLGDRWSCARMGSRSPIVKANESVSVERVEPHAEVEEWRRKLGMDYGKLDYVVHNGKPVLLDANKTIGASLYAGAKGSIDEQTILANRRALAAGIDHFL